MLKLKINEKDFDDLEREREHDELVQAVLAIAQRDDKGELTRLARQVDTLLRTLAQKDFTTDMRPMVEAIKVLKPVKPNKPPTRFHVERDKQGRIEYITVVEDAT